MARPSMFSRDYEKQIRRRRINTTLFILIIIFASYFGARYYMDKNGIVLSKPGLFTKKINQDIEEKKPLAANTTKDNSQMENKPEENQAQEKGLYYEYKSANAVIYKIEYEAVNGEKYIIDFDDKSSGASYDISTDRKNITFDDPASGDVFVMNSDGILKKVSPDSYRSKSAGIVIQKYQVLKSKPSYIWARKPHFTSDGKIVYLSDLPYIVDDSKVHLWNANPAGGLSRMSGQLNTNDINKISYDGFDTKGSLKIRFDNATYYLAPNSYKLAK